MFQNFPTSHTTRITTGAALFRATWIAPVKKPVGLGSMYSHWMLLGIDFSGTSWRVVLLSLFLTYAHQLFEYTVIDWKKPPQRGKQHKLQIVLSIIRWVADLWLLLLSTPTLAFSEHCWLESISLPYPCPIFRITPVNMTPNSVWVSLIFICHSWCSQCLVNYIL